MPRPFVLSTKLFVTFCFLAACTGDAGPTGPAGAAGGAGPAGPAGPTGDPGIESFTAVLNEANVVGGGTGSTATGTASISVVGPILLYRIDVAGITDVTATHIHGPAAAGTNAGVLLGLCSSGNAPDCASGTVDGVLVSDAASSALGISFDSLVVLLRNGNAYVNVHTNDFPGGEIRGQITP